MVTRRDVVSACIAAIAAAMVGTPALATDKVVKIGMDLSLTGADSEGAIRIRNGIMMAIEAVNEANGAPMPTARRQTYFFMTPPFPAGVGSKLPVSVVGRSPNS